MLSSFPSAPLAPGNIRHKFPSGKIFQSMLCLLAEAPDKSIRSLAVLMAGGESDENKRPNHIPGFPGLD